MIPPFSGHPLVQQFNALKKYFRQHETAESRNRIHEFRKFSYVIKKAGLDVAFDFVGSLNFGQSIKKSDVDVVLYMECETYRTDCMDCNCDLYNNVSKRLLDSFIREYADSPYEVQVVDCINLKVLLDDLILENSESDSLIRFAFYRSICRSVNSSLIRPFQQRLTDNRILMERLRPHIWPIFDGLIKNQQHNLSIRKYQERLQEDGIRIPSSMRRRIILHMEAASRRSDTEGGKNG